MLKKRFVEKLKYKILFFLIFFFFTYVKNVKAQDQAENKSSISKYCDESNEKTFSEFMCAEQQIHESMLNNPLGFIIFYVVSILFLAFLYRMSTRNMRNKKNKN